MRMCARKQMHMQNAHAETPHLHCLLGALGTPPQVRGEPSQRLDAQAAAQPLHDPVLGVQHGRRVGPAQQQRAQP